MPHLRAAILLLVASCAPASQTDYAPTEIPSDLVSQTSSPEPQPERGQNDIAMEQWQLSPLPHRTPSFPYLEDEDQTISRSIGDVSFGHLVSAKAMQYPHPRISMLSVHAGRDLIYTTDQMAALIEAAAKLVDTRYPGSVTFVGNFSAVGGGDIPYSVSHNNGRDADLAFFMVDEKGDPVAPPDLLPFDDNGSYTDPDGAVFQFDVPRNWALVEGLLNNGDGTLQLILISNPLKKLLIEYAKEEGVDSSLVALARSTLIQPSGALPHNDHFHVRIHCSKTDIESGCRNGGRKGRGYQSYSEARSESIEAARASLSSDDPTKRAAGIRRLAILRDRAGKNIAAKLSSDPSPIVRAAAARALGSLRTETKALAKQLALEEEGSVTIEIIWALSEIRSKTALKAVSKFLETPHVRSIDAVEPFDVRMVAADALINFESKTPVSALIDLVASDDTELANRAHRALTFLTGIDITVKRKDPPAKKSKKKKKKKRKRKRKKKSVKKAEKKEPLTRAEKWAEWWKANKRKSRSAWLVDGFRASGFDVTKLNIKNVWDICRAIIGSDYVSFNAQRSLMRMTGRRVASLDWSKEDASFNWRRWFERRQKKLRAPKVPPELSTLNPPK